MVINNHFEVSLLSWLQETGVMPAGKSVWHWETHANDSRSAHTRANCDAMNGHSGVQEVCVDLTTLAKDYWICKDCLLGNLIDENVEPETRKKILSDCYQLRTLAKWVEDADSDFHVIVGRQFPALHAAIVDDVASHTRHALTRLANGPLTERLAELVRQKLDAVVAAHPFDREAAIDEAVVTAVRSAFRSAKASDLFEFQLKDHHNAVQELREQLIGRIRAAGDPRREAQNLLADNPQLVRCVPRLGEIVDRWVNCLEELLGRTAPTFYATGGFALTLHSVPRGARDWVIRAGLRAVQHHWGLGELPEIVVENLTAHKPDREASVSRIDLAHCELTTDQWEIAGALWKEHMHGYADKALYADPARAIEAAACL